MDRMRSRGTCPKNSGFLEVFGTFRVWIQDFLAPADKSKRVDPHAEREVSMTILEVTRNDNDASGAPEKGFVVKSGAGYRSEQGSDYEPGVSAETVGSKSIWLGMISLAPGKRTRAHVHEFHETALYMLSGDEMELWTGDQLQYRDIVSPGDYIFIPANMLHVAVNRSTQPAVFIGSRDEATAQESVVLQADMDRRVP
jgi:uncharacterized RmlC-like cupin family protein